MLTISDIVFISPRLHCRYTARYAIRYKAGRGRCIVPDVSWMYFGCCTQVLRLACVVAWSLQATRFISLAGHLTWVCWRACGPVAADNLPTTYDIPQHEPKDCSVIVIYRSPFELAQTLEVFLNCVLKIFWGTLKSLTWPAIPYQW